MRRLPGPRALALACLLALLPAMILLSRDYGATYDERFQQKYGEELWEYVHGRRARAAFDTEFGHQNLYGGTFELAAVAAQHAYPRTNIYVVRHQVNAAFGWLAVVFCWLTARKLFGEWTGLLAMALLLLTPRFLGHSMNNPKDIPFAAFATAAVYFLTTIRSRAPYMTWSHALKLATAIGLAVSVRAVGLLFAAYLIAILACFSLASRAYSRATLFRLAGLMVVVVAILTIVSVSTWPWAQGDPFRRPLRAFQELSRFSWEGSVLFDGAWIPAVALPRSYLPRWLILSFPPVMLAGALLSLVRLRVPEERRAVAILWMCAAVPLVAAFARRATLYDGLRHFLFVVPILAVLAAAGWMAIAHAARAPLRVVAVALLGVGLAEPFSFVLRNHPNEVVYFSPLTGGPRAAFGRYDMDYWGNCMYQATRWMADRAAAVHMPLAVSGAPDHMVFLNAERVGSLYFTKPQIGHHHFGLHLLRGPRESVLEFNARGDILYRVQTADGTPLCVVLAGPVFPEIRERLSQAQLSSPAR